MTPRGTQQHTPSCTHTHSAARTHSGRTHAQRQLGAEELEGEELRDELREEQEDLGPLEARRADHLGDEVRRDVLGRGEDAGLRGGGGGERPVGGLRLGVDHQLREETRPERQ